MAEARACSAHSPIRDPGTHIGTAAIHGNVEALQAQLSGGAADVALDVRDAEHGFSALCLAAAAGKAEAVRVLVQAGADLECQDKARRRSPANPDPNPDP